MSADLVTGIVAFILTLMILSYVVGDNPAFRLAVHIFVGVTAGYIAAVAWWQVLLPRLILPLLIGSTATRAMLAVPLLLSGLLLMKAWPPLARLGAPALGFLVGAASAVGIAGAIQGTLVPQAMASVDAFNAANLASVETVFNTVLVLVGFITSLAYFHFSGAAAVDGNGRRRRAMGVLAGVGGVFLAISFGVIFAGVYSAALTALVERLDFLLVFLGIR